MSFTKVANVACKPMWHHIDGKGQVVGRLATQIAKLLMGKHKPSYVPHVDCGDYVVVTNVENVVFTGRKEDRKMYYWHTPYPGGIKSISVAHQREKAPERILEEAVRGMLPRNKMHPHRLRRLRLIVGEENKHQPNTAGSVAYAPEFMAACAPRAKIIAGGEGAGDFVVDYTGPDEKPLPADTVDPEDPKTDVDALINMLKNHPGN